MTGPKDYIIVTGTSVVDMAAKVSKRLRDGWQCQGGVVIAEKQLGDGVVSVFNQAMVK
jgi:hypothetical protein